MIGRTRFTRVNFDQVTCISGSLVRSMAAVKRPAGPANAHLHRAWRADSPREEFLTG